MDYDQQANTIRFTDDEQRLLTCPESIPVTGGALLELVFRASETIERNQDRAVQLETGFSKQHRNDARVLAAKNIRLETMRRQLEGIGHIVDPDLFYREA